MLRHCPGHNEFSIEYWVVVLQRFHSTRIVSQLLHFLLSFPSFLYRGGYNHSNSSLQGVQPYRYDFARRLSQLPRLLACSSRRLLASPIAPKRRRPRAELLAGGRFNPKGTDGADWFAPWRSQTKNPPRKAQPGGPVLPPRHPCHGDGICGSN